VLSSSVLAVAAPAPEAFLDALAGEPAASPAIESARPLTRARRTAAPVPTSSATTAATTAALARASAPLATGGSGPARSTAVTAASPQALARSTATRAATSGSLPGSTAITAGAGEAFAGSTAPTGSAAYGEYVPASRAVSRTGVARSSAVTALARALAAQPGQAAVAGGAIGRAAARADAAQPAFATALASTSPVARSVARSAPAPAPALRRLPWASAGSDLPLPQMPSMAAEPVVEPVPVQAPTRTASRSEAPSVRTPAAPLPGPSAPLARAATGPASSTAVTAGAAGAVARSSATVAQAGAGTFAGQSPLHRTADAAWMGAPVARRTTSSPASRALSRAEAPQAAPGTSESPTHRSTRHSGTPAVRAIARFGLPGSSAPTGRSVARSLSVAAGLGKLPSVTSGGDLADRLAPGIRRSRLIAPEAIVAQLPDPSAQVPEVEPTVAAPVARRAAATPATTASPATLPRSTATVARSATGVARSSAITASAQIADRRAAEATTRSPLSRAFQRAGVGEGPTSATPPQGSSATVARASRRVAAPERSLAHPRPLTGRSIDPVLPQLTLPWSGTESTAEVAVPMGGLPSASAPVAGPSEPAARSTASSSVTRALARAEAPTGGPVALHEGGPLVRRPGYRPALSRGELPALAGFPAFAQEPAGVDSTSVTAAGARPAARSTARTAGQIQTSAGSTARTASPGRAASRSTARTAGPVQRRAHIGAPTATLPSLHRLASSATTADSATGPARSTARTAGRVEPRGLFRALQRDADVAVGIAAHSTLVAPDLIHSTAPEALLASEVVGEVQAESAPLRRRSGRSSIARPSTTLPRRFARRAEATALTAPYARGVARSSAVVATVADLRTGDGFPDIETGSSDSQPVADASGMVSRAARRLRSTAPRASRRAALTSELPRTSAPGVTVSRKELTRLVRKEMTELTTISAPAPTVHRSQVNRGLAEEIRRESAPTTQQSGAGASTKDLEDFLKRAVRRMLKEEAIRSERDLTPWD
jgi:hypothetical protein